MIMNIIIRGQGLSEVRPDSHYPTSDENLQKDSDQSLISLWTRSNDDQTVRSKFLGEKWRNSPLASVRHALIYRNCARP
ncbi:hypothetical protein CEXT_342221 [Caerostris extrusa]|uniref:Uncharacterized protein n=1 Tax=Caerostris extrusa TaxID=172846 RepID=A0AAV4Q2R6_CAEEX|nr:hypothetical protein CEXT_342221 [Caerostris extrusa]